MKHVTHENLQIGDNMKEKNNKVSAQGFEPL